MKYRLSTLLILITLACVGLGVYVWRERLRKENAALAEKLWIEPEIKFDHVRSDQIAKLDYSDEELLQFARDHRAYRQHSPSREIFLGALWRLGYRRNEEIVAIAEPLLEDPDDEVRAYAVSAMQMSTRYWYRARGAWTYYDDWIEGDMIDSPQEAIAVASLLRFYLSWGGIDPAQYNDSSFGPKTSPGASTVLALREVGLPVAAKKMQRILEIVDVGRNRYLVDEFEIDFSVDKEGQGLESEFKRLEAELREEVSQQKLAIYMLRHRDELPRLKL